MDNQSYELEGIYSSNKDKMETTKIDDGIPPPITNGAPKYQSTFFLNRALQNSQDSMGQFFESNRERMGLWIKITLFLLISAHFAWATYYFIDITGTHIRGTMCDGYGFLMLLYIAIVYGSTYTWLLKPYIFRPIGKFIWNPIKKILKRIFKDKITNVLGHLIILIAALAYLIVDARDDWYRLMPLVGMSAFVILGFLCSKHPGHINWRPVIWGFIAQFVFGLLTVRWEVGRSIFKCAGDKVTVFLDYGINGSAFVYGDMLVHEYQIFAFQAVTVIYFFNFCINILYYYEIMQKIILVIGQFLRSIIGTSICESVNSAANIFLGQSETPLLLKPYLKNFTTSEFHTMLTSGFATISGTVLAAYISFGAKAEHLITATVMAAPTALAYSKLMYPEMEEIKNTKESISLVKSEHKSVLDAASKGAAEATMIVLNILANLIAFIAFVYFVNGVLTWMGQLCGYVDADELWTLEIILGYIFTPISYIMGVPWEECQIVGRLIGVKMMVNEFVAFAQFAELRDQLSARTQVIVTYAIVGFGNPGSVGLMISALSTLVPEKSSVVTSVIIRAYICGTIVCLLTASMAALLITEDMVV